MPKFRETFNAVYDQYKEYKGLKFKYVGMTDPSTYDHAETDDLYIIAVSPEDGPSVLIEAWPEEVLDPDQPEEQPDPLKWNIRRWGEYFAKLTDEQLDQLTPEQIRDLDFALEEWGDTFLMNLYKPGDQVQTKKGTGMVVDEAESRPYYIVYIDGKLEEVHALEMSKPE